MCRPAGRLDEVAWIGQDEVDLELAFFGTGDGVDVLGESAEPLGARTEDCQGWFVEVADAVLECLEMSIKRGQRCAHLVSEIGEHSASGDLHGVESFSKLVEGGGALVELTAKPGAGNTRAVPARGNLRCRIGHSSDRALHTPVSYTHLRAHETDSYLVCRLL